MAVKQLVPANSSKLRKPAAEVKKFDDSLKQLLLDIEDTLYDTEASALSAPQIGVSLQAAIIDMEAEGLLQLINPTIIRQSDETVTDLEGSISFPDVFGTVTRSQMIVVQSYDLHGNKVELTAYDDVARMILHIVDQLKGIPFTEKMEKQLTEEELEAYLEDE
ncbi:peptide deformylase [Staphylococcus carnosus]|uniref:Peptide deformylase-like n=1 Tax=Staphylococcus carnosus TaxID=1281 RepID=A0AAJ0JSK2_STACA|nr:peptide deformylase [Staphylococcus carnosus]ANZ33580.1 peptide deformylase [Staphylococcus carnosus]KKB26497.1 peptide deformylase [Staphylococcus carnosus]KOR13879.1 peptide deformylase [Staphylococcus carnosus]POA08177.1 peptide deformylase [Staphylococcus carnosus]QQS85452.1 peptide deformylase [Staphylococcus carnosus]